IHPDDQLVGGIASRAGGKKQEKKPTEKDQPRNGRKSFCCWKKAHGRVALSIFSPTFEMPSPTL
ncbi:MAG: hypothetical protein ACOVLK_09180, partial [Terrimicrobiaceae bacterium]